jgi:hypothetical protein
VTFVGSNTLGVQTGKDHTQNSDTKEHGGGGDTVAKGPQVFCQSGYWDTSLPRPSHYLHR